MRAIETLYRGALFRSRLEGTLGLDVRPARLGVGVRTVGRQPLHPRLRPTGPRPVLVEVETGSVSARARRPRRTGRGRHSRPLGRRLPHRRRHTSTIQRPHHRLVGELPPSRRTARRHTGLVEDTSRMGRMHSLREQRRSCPQSSPSSFVPAATKAATTGKASTPVSSPSCGTKHTASPAGQGRQHDPSLHASQNNNTSALPSTPVPIGVHVRGELAAGVVHEDRLL